MTDIVRAMAHSAGDEMHVSGEEKARSSGTLYTGGWDHVIRALDDQTGEQRWKNKRHRRPIACLSVSCGKDGGTFLFSGSYDGTCRAIRTNDGTEVWKYSGHTQPVRAVCATALDPGGMRKKVVELENWIEMLTGVDLDGDGDVGVVDRVGVVFTGSEDGTVCALEGCSGELLWKHDPEVPRSHGVYACCDVVNRGAAVWKGRVYVGTIDGRLLALDAANGTQVWSQYDDCQGARIRRHPFLCCRDDRCMKPLPVGIVRARSSPSSSQPPASRWCAQLLTVWSAG